MVTRQQKKQFALQQLAPYLADRSTCGYDQSTDTCKYLTHEGRMCVAGKNMIDPSDSRWDIKGIYSILCSYTQSEVFKPEAVGILDKSEWQWMQQIHDNLALNDESLLILSIEDLGLFTYEELQHEADKLKSNQS